MCLIRTGCVPAYPQAKYNIWVHSLTLAARDKILEKLLTTAAADGRLADVYVSDGDEQNQQ